MEDDLHIPDAVVQDWLERCGGDPAYEASFEPLIFAALWRGDFDVTQEDLAEHAGGPWWYRGLSMLSPDEWREAFTLAGYRIDGEPAERPRQALTLWRGAMPRFRSNPSWADRYDAALLFASGCGVQDEVGLIWRAVVEPERLMARITYQECGGFSEYVVDTDGLEIEPYGLCCRCPVDLSQFAGSDEAAQVALDIHELVTCQKSM